MAKHALKRTLSYYLALLSYKCYNSMKAVQFVNFDKRSYLHLREEKYYSNSIAPTQ